MTLCSACGAQLLPGAPNCPNCLLPLTATAVPAPVARRVRFPYAVLAIGLCIVFLYGVSQFQTQSASDSRDRLAAALHGKLANPAAFQSQCGAARSEKTKDGETILDYGSMQVHIQSGSARFVRPDDHLTIDGQMGMDAIGCKLK